LDPEDKRKLIIGAIWNFAEGTGLFYLVENMGHKEPVLRPRRIGPGRARNQILFYSILLYSILLYSILDMSRHAEKLHKAPEFQHLAN